MKCFKEVKIKENAEGDEATVSHLVIQSEILYILPSDHTDCQFNFTQRQAHCNPFGPHKNKNRHLDSVWDLLLDLRNFLSILRCQN